MHRREIISIQEGMKAIRWNGRLPTLQNDLPRHFPYPSIPQRLHLPFTAAFPVWRRDHFLNAGSFTRQEPLPDYGSLKTKSFDAWIEVEKNFNPLKTNNNIHIIPSTKPSFPMSDDSITSDIDVKYGSKGNIDSEESCDSSSTVSNPSFTRRQEEVTLYSNFPPYVETYSIYQVVKSDPVTKQPKSIHDESSQCPTHSTSSSLASQVTSSASSETFKDPDVVTIGEVREHMCYYVLCCGLCCD